MRLSNKELNRAPSKKLNQALRKVLKKELTPVNKSQSGMFKQALVAILLLICYSLEAQTVTFAAIGDYGKDSSGEQAVAEMINSWNVDFVITLGDNNYNSGAASTIDKNIGKHYQQYIYPYNGSYGNGSASKSNRFWPSLGNHDWYASNAQPYLDYFTLPNNERYYDFVQGPVHFFVIDSDSKEPDGISQTSTQANWIKQKLAESSAPWKIVYMHHAPYSSGSHGSNSSLQWPFEAWGASAVLAGHDHDFERLQIGNIPYFVNGLGGKSTYSFGSILSQSQYRYNSNHGAMLMQADEEQLNFKFYAINSTEPKDNFSLNRNIPVDRQSWPELFASRGEWHRERITLPTGIRSLVVTIAGGSGDVDLYVNAQSAPTDDNWHCRPYVNGNSETCTLTNPEAGDWYIGLKAWSSFSGVTATATWY